MSTLFTVGWTSREVQDKFTHKTAQERQMTLAAQAYARLRPFLRVVPCYDDLMVTARGDNEGFIGLKADYRWCQVAAGRPCIILWAPDRTDLEPPTFQQYWEGYGAAREVRP